MAIAGKNSKKVNDKKLKKKEELAKDRTWIAIGAFDNVCLNCLETKSESRRRRKKNSIFFFFDKTKNKIEFSNWKSGKHGWQIKNNFLGVKRGKWKLNLIGRKRNKKKKKKPIKNSKHFFRIRT